MINQSIGSQTRDTQSGKQTAT